MRNLLIILEMIKFEHTIFALPFAFLGAFIAARGFPGWATSFWIIVAMFGARSAAMAFNRLTDRHFDALNPRTRERALPKGILRPSGVLLFVVASSLFFLFASSMLNPLALALSPLALLIVFFYSYTKRFTSLSHLVLGLALGIAPVGGWVAVTGTLDLPPFLLTAAVLFWVAGFDIIYACQDTDFDRKHGLFSIPAMLGIRSALRVSILFHFLMLVLLAIALVLFSLSFLSWLGLVLVAIALLYEHRLVSHDDLSRVNAAFFTMNGVISVTLSLFVGLDLCLFA